MSGGIVIAETPITTHTSSGAANLLWFRAALGAVWMKGRAVERGQAGSEP